MNDERRKELRHAQALIAEAMSKLDAAKAIVEECVNEEQDYFDKMSDRLQGSDIGIAAEDAIAVLQSVSDDIDNFMGDDPASRIEAIL